MKAPNDVVSELAVLANAFGAPRWAQGPGGNVSLKHEGILWVKASGARLATVAQGGSHVGVSLDDATRALEGDADADARVFARTPRPSLETYFHALGAKVVAHTHAVGVLLAACADGDAASALGVASVPYARPGRGLALGVAAARKAAPDRPVMLLSHGLLVDADTAADAVATSRAIDAQAIASFGADDASFVELLGRYTAAPVVAAPGGFVRALPPRPARGRYLFPDAVVYASVVQVRSVSSLPASVAALGRAVVVVDDANERVAFAKSQSALDSCVEVAAAHDWVEDVLSARGVARYLPDDEPAMILDLPSEKYRMKLE